MLYSYSAKNHKGEAVHGTIDALDKFELSRELRKRGLVLISSTQEEKRGGSFQLSVLLAPILKVRYLDKTRFFDGLATMIDSGLTLSRALTVLVRQTRNEKLKTYIKKMIERTSHGDPFADTLASFDGVFSEEAIALVRAGEASGSLPAVLRRVAENMKRRNNIVRMIRGAMVYPAVVIVLMVSIGFFMLTVVVPPLVQTFESFNVELPLLTRVMIATGTFVNNHLLGTLISFVLVIVLTLRAIGSKTGKRVRDSLFLQLPGLKGLVKEYYAGTTMRTLAALLSAGVDIVESLEITKKTVTNFHYQDALQQAREDLQRGTPVHAVFLEREDLFPPYVSEMAEVGGETGRLAPMLDEVATVYEDHISSVTKNISSIIEPLLMVVVGLFVALFAIAVIDPLYSLTSSLS
ncbi:MAG: type II secretion system F family protein [bacterium]|nr:type II secretion system F family protein [bacterium]